MIEFKKVSIQFSDDRYAVQSVACAAWLADSSRWETSLNNLGGQITDDEMREMNYEVNVKGKEAFQVAKAYLKKKKLLK